MADQAVTFDDGVAYERFMGRWSRAVGALFLDWVAPSRGARWLDVGCGTGAFTEQVLDGCAPSEVVAVDPSSLQIEHARQQPIAKRADFRVADAQSLPFPDGGFDVVASALVINFIPDPAGAVAEMKRVARRGGMVAGYVWDFAGGRATAWPIMRGMRQVGGPLPAIPGNEVSSADALHAVFAQAGLQDIATRPLEVMQSYRDFNDYWGAQTPPFTPVGKAVAAMSEPQNARLMDAVRAIVPARADGSIAYSACANAIKARVPD